MAAGSRFGRSAASGLVPSAANRVLRSLGNEACGSSGKILTLGEFCDHMKKAALLIPLALITVLSLVAQPAADSIDPHFPPELVRFSPYSHNPVFQGTGGSTWDKQIRERGWILREGNNWHLWYTGYTNINDTKFLGYASSTDGINWKRYPQNPLLSNDWVEDICVVKSGNTYYMFAEGRGDTAHLLLSTDRIHWTEQGNLDIRLTNGEKIPAGPFGTPAAWKENETWYLFYERNDSAIWLASSKDLKTWTNVQDEPVLQAGPETYDSHAVAMNQVIRYKGLYYGYYHASAFADWHEWSTNVAVSSDLIHWKKFAGNPVIGNDKSSGILVDDGRLLRLYTMHPEVNLYFPAPRKK
jgi:hypothetical protein